MARHELAPEALQYFNRFSGGMADFEITDAVERSRSADPPPRHDEQPRKRQQPLAIGTRRIGLIDSPLVLGQKLRLQLGC